MGIINNKGDVILPLEYIYVRHFDNGFGIIQGQDSLLGFTDKTGKVIKPEYENVENFNGWKNALVSKHNKFGVINSDGKLIVPIEYDFIDLENERRGICIIKKGEKYGLMNSKGVFIKAEYEWAERIGDEYFILKKNGKLGLAGKKGIILNTEYENIKILDSKHFIVKINGKYGVINAKGKYKVEAAYDDIERLYSSDFPSEISKVVLLFYKEGKVGIIEKKSWKIILKPQYEFIGCKHLEFGYIPKVAD